MIGPSKAELERRVNFVRPVLVYDNNGEFVPLKGYFHLTQHSPGEPSPAYIDATLDSSLKHVVSVPQPDKTDGYYVSTDEVPWSLQLRMAITKMKNAAGNEPDKLSKNPFLAVKISFGDAERLLGDGNHILIKGHEASNLNLNLAANIK